MNTVIYGPDATPGQLAVSYALMEVGAKEDPPGSNRGPRVDAYLRAAGLDPSEGDYPWCAAFVTWCVREACLRRGPLRWRGSPSVHRLWELNRELSIPFPEENCVFVHFESKDTTRGHCGFMTKVRDSGELLTVEGNTDAQGSRTGGQVMQRTRPAGYALRFLRIG